MKIDRERAIKAFKNYVKTYNTEEEKVRLKIEHTYRVSRLCEVIAQSLGLSGDDVDLAWLIGLLHDVGRFEQIRNYGTFNDAESIDHAVCGADILFEEGRIRDYTETDSCAEGHGAAATENVIKSAEDKLIWTAVNYHNAYRIPTGLDARTEQFCHIIRDADKIDILKVNIEFPLEEIYNVTSEELRNGLISDAVMRAVEEEHTVLRTLKRTAVDNVVGHISLVYELVYPISIRLVKEQGYLEKLMNFRTENQETRKQFRRIREKLGEYVMRGMREADSGT